MTLLNDITHGRVWITPLHQLFINERCCQCYCLDSSYFLGTGTQWEETGWEAVVTGLQGLPELFRKSKTALSYVRFLSSLLHVIRACVLFCTSTPTLSSFLYEWIVGVFRAPSYASLNWKWQSRVWENTAHPFSEKTPDHPIALLRGNPNQAITTKHESLHKDAGRPRGQQSRRYQRQRLKVGGTESREDNMFF